VDSDLRDFFEKLQAEIPATHLMRELTGVRAGEKEKIEDYQP
jgi:hypothetical protein